MTKIGLDAGHGGSSTGTNSVGSKYEKYYTLELCKLVKTRLEKNGFDVYMTRTTDTNPGTVSERAQMCIKAGCNYAVSIHFNGFEKESANGCEVFVPHGEKAAGIEAGYYKYLGEFFNHRAPFAKANNYTNRNDVFDKKLNVQTRKFDAVTSTKQDYFGFIRTAWQKGYSYDLLEVCFLTNKQDFATFTENMEAVADAIARSIVEGYKKTYTSVSTTTVKVPAETEKPATGAKYRVIAGSFSTKANADAHVKALKAKGFDAFVEVVK